MPNAYISGSGAHVPPRVVTNDDLVTEYGIDTSDEWIQQRTGIVERRFAADGVGTADLGAAAAKQAIEAAGLELKDIDMLIAATLSPEHCFPGTGVYIAEKIGFPEAGHFVPCLDVRNQCSGFLYSLATAASMVKAGGAKHVVCVGAEKHSAALDLTTRGRTVSSLFGDGAGAVVVSATEEDRGVRAWTLGADGRYADSLTQKVWDIRRSDFIPGGEDGAGVVDPEMKYAFMDGRKVFKNAVQRMIESIMTVCMKTGVIGTDIDLFLFHQANKRINEYVAKQLGIPEEKLVHNIERYGNTTAATIPLLIAEAERDGRLQPGMKVAMAAFGSGFTWGGAIVDW